MEKPRHHHSVFWPILLISAGIIFLLSNIGVLGSGIGELFSTYWPLIFVAAGLDGIFRREGWVGAILLIGLGTVLILANLGYFAWDSLKILLKLWPIFLIAWGFDLIFKGRPAWASIFGVLLAVILVGGILWLGFTQTGSCLLYTSDAADDLLCVDLGGRRIIKKKKITNTKTKQNKKYNTRNSTSHHHYRVKQTMRLSKFVSNT